MARYERGIGGRRSIWEIEVDGRAWRITYGQAHKPLEEYRREHPTPELAQAEAEKLIASRIADGFRLVEPAPPRPPPAPPSELEQHVLANPDDVDAYLVLADELQQRGDPRGRLIVVQHQGLADEAREIIREHRGALLGELAELDPNASQIEFRLGHLDAIRIAEDREYNRGSLDVLGALLSRPDAALLRTLRVGLSDDLELVVEQLAKHAAQLPRLRRLHVADFMFPDESELSWVVVGDVSPLRAFARLEELYLKGAGITLGELAFPALRTFELVTTDDADLGAIAAAAWPRLERLVVWLGAAELADLVPILELEGLAELRHAGFCNAANTDELCEMLGGTPLARQLETLDLSCGTLTDAGAALLAREATFARLRRLDVSENYLSDVGLAALATLGVELVAGDQRPYEDERYQAVTE